VHLQFDIDELASNVLDPPSVSPKGSLAHHNLKTQAWVCSVDLRETLILHGTDIKLADVNCEL